MTEPLVQARRLTKHYVLRGGFFGRKQIVRALHWVDLTIYPGETFGVVGESGCGKTTLGRCLLRLIEPTFGEVLFQGEDLLQLDRETLRQRRRSFQMVFQNPYLSLDPRMNVLNLVGEPLVTHTGLRGRALAEQVVALLERVGLSADHLYRYPHEFSGGQLQRIAIARALALRPLFVVLDEPTSALDVSVQAQILNLLKELQAELGLTYLFISHDLSVVQHMSDRIAVMYLGRIVEVSTTEGIFHNARHPYTQALISSTPILDPQARRARIVLQGSVPSPLSPPPGCPFHPRCSQALPLCAAAEPELVDVGDGHLVACHRNH
ncbi:MAG: dipeptide ABC transporter ATP-binding protein [Anaerolineae bacterium]|nr:dipeptide ABC transporter ATP-binding protein [Anaerolineae bacterium]MDW7991700.1 dipeptide ABC transporter ATP-binding protein [Anaerolineae bacterium]MDW8069564.1 dipeptide ABC transporter ATP-binding protein [Anaerolineae bacterium]